MLKGKSGAFDWVRTHVYLHTSTYNESNGLTIAPHGQAKNNFYNSGLYRFVSGIKIDIFTVPNSENDILIVFTVACFGTTFYST